MTAPDESGAVIVDARGMRCPWPALRLARAMRSASVVTLLAHDPQAGREIAALAAEQGWMIDPVAAGSWRVRRG